MLVVLVVGSKLFGYVIEGVRVDIHEGAKKHPQLRFAEHNGALSRTRSEFGYTRLMQPSPLELLSILFGFSLLFLLKLLSLLLVAALPFLGLFLCLGFGRGCHCWAG